MKPYIVNLVEQLVGRGLMEVVTSQRSNFQMGWDIRPLLEPVIKPKLQKMTAETLGKIIEWGDVSFRQCNAPEIVWREPIIRPNNRTGQVEAGAWATCGGKLLLSHLAMLTILAVVFDMINQSEYTGEEIANSLTLKDI